MSDILVAPHQGGFGAVRKHDRHTGVDIYTQDGTPVFAIEDGVVIKVGQFTGEAVGSPWWRDTWAIIVDGTIGAICYGEIEPVVKTGDFVHEGDLLGQVRQVLKKDKGLPMSMLHVELYENGYLGDWAEWNLDDERPRGLLDPTSFLQHLVEMHRWTKS